MMSTAAVRATVLLALFTCEILLITVLRGALGFYISPLLLLIVSLAIGIVPLIGRQASAMPKTGTGSINSRFIGLFIWMISTGLLGWILADAFRMDPAPWSDVIPQAMTMAERVTSGHTVYEVIQFGGEHSGRYDLTPTYMPFQFLPFTLSVWTGIDPRWIAFGVWRAAGLIFQLWLVRRRLSPLTYVLLSLAPGVSIVLLHQGNPQSFQYSFEIMIAGYYWLLAMALLSRRLLVMAGAIILCLLSRYSLVLWLPLLLLIAFTHDSRKRALQLAGLVVAGVLALYVIPFVVNTPRAFLNAYEYHTGAAQSLWSWARFDNGAWHSIFTGTGMAPWFFNEGGDRTAQLDLLRVMHFALTGLAVVIPATVFYLSRRKPEPLLFALCALKICLAVFYGFIQLPFVYLFMVPMFVSLVILASVSARRTPYSI